ncbi:MAG: DNA-processing protein DprA [Planctomycetota bacterium]|nr:DNA-processing protein DprA [Planctomycetota bacterium]
MALRDYLHLSLTKGLGPVLIRRLVEYAGSAEKACLTPAADLAQIEGIGEAKARGIAESLRTAAADADTQIRKATELGARLIALDDDAYPPLLKDIHDPPPVLYVLGSIEDRDLNALCIVGSRRCTYYGREQAERFAALLAGAGFTVVSGGARGIDSAAHRGALQHPDGRTITVLGSGLDVPYPPENENLFKQIAQRGAVISEFPFGTSPTAENFPRRNRVVSGMARGVFVVEADQRSGALITARLANEDQGRPVFALPGRVDNLMAAGTHQLIRDGAILVACLEDILAGLHPFPDSVREPAATEQHAEKPADRPILPSLSEPQQLIIQHLTADPITIDQLIDRTSLDASVILQSLTYLSLKGLIKRMDGQTYARGR